MSGAPSRKPDRVARKGTVLRLLKKQIRKEDGRYLVFYHAPNSASAEQTATFEAIPDPAEAVTVNAAVAGTATAAGVASEQKGEDHV